MSEKVTAPFRMLRAVCDDAGPADVVHLKEANGCLMAETMRLGAMLGRKTTERDNAVAELAHVREQLASTLCVIERDTTEAANAVVYANVDTSLSDPRPGKLLVVRIDEDDAEEMRKGWGVDVSRSQCVVWLEAAQDEGDTETRDVHHAGAPMPVVRCGECTATVGYFGDCAKAVQP